MQGAEDFVAADCVSVSITTISAVDRTFRSLFPLSNGDVSTVRDGMCRKHSEETLTCGRDIAQVMRDGGVVDEGVCYHDGWLWDEGEVRRDASRRGNDGRIGSRVFSQILSKDDPSLSGEGVSPQASACAVAQSHRGA